MPTSVTCFSCKECKQIYTTSRQASNCEQRHVRKRAAETAAEQKMQRESKIADEVRLTSRNLHEIQTNLIAWVAKYHKLKISFTRGFDSLSMRWVSNSHNCPIDGVTNWCNEHKDRPTGYYGWQGRIEGKITTLDGKKFDKYYFSDILANRFSNDKLPYCRGINSGSGGGGNEGFGYDLQLFVDDFPLLKEKFLRVTAQWKLKHAYEIEKNRLQKVFEQGVVDLCNINPNHMEAANRLQQVISEQHSLEMEHHKLDLKLAQIKTSTENKLISDHPRILHPDPTKFEFQSEEFFELSEQLHLTCVKDGTLDGFMQRANERP